MPKLGDVAQLIRSKNAGPFHLTFDIMFPDRETYLRARQSKGLTRSSIADLYGIPVDHVEVFPYEPALAIKISIPRKTISCDLGDTDTHGGQQFVPLLDVDV